MMNREPARLVIRADAGPQIGAGHVMRCLALAQAWHDRGGEAHFVARELPTAIRDRLAAEGIAFSMVTTEPGSTADAEATAAVARRIAASWVVADGYSFGPIWQRVVRGRSLQLLLIDDYAPWPHYDVDMLLNQNAGASPAAYRSLSGSAELLVSSQFALVRREFRNAKQDAAAGGGKGPVRARRVLVTFGGSDPQNVTPRVLTALAELGRAKLEVVAVAGGANDRLEELRGMAASAPYALGVCANPTNLPELMNWADVAVAAAGSTTWELAHLGVPSCLVVVAENQVAVAEHAARGGYAVNVGWHGDLTIGHLSSKISALLDDAKRQAAMSRAGRAAIDGQGALRVVEAMERLTASGTDVTPQSGAA